MADVTKPLNLAIPGAERYLVVTNTDLANGDTLRVFESMLKAGKSLTITTSAGCDLSIQLNRFVVVAPVRRSTRFDSVANIMGGEPNMALAAEQDVNPGFITIGAASAQNYNETVTPIRNLTVKYTTGTFTITVG